MDIIKEIINACTSGKNNPIQNFGGFIIEDKLGQGQQGIVLKVKNNIDKHFALKFYRPTDKSPDILKESIPRFINEVKTLASLNHKNIVRIYTGGSASWDGVKWTITEGFNNKNKTDSIGENELYYYIMDYIEGYDLTYIFPELAESEKEKKNGECFPFTLMLAIWYALLLYLLVL